jgi:coenzyme F420-reducing hydrogenase beta subunit
MITIDEKRKCMGCHACSNICPQNCISMETDSEGFWYPKVDYDKCVGCVLCIKVCPIINKASVQNEPKAYACINKDEYIRSRSSSGGIFAIIAEHVIDEGGIVFGAGFDENFNVSHRYVNAKEELDKLRGAKYVQSKVGNTFIEAKKFLVQGKKVLFTGTPCQIGGLRSFLGKTYGNLLCVDIICHGVPSPIVWKKYVSYRKNRVGSSIQGINFRLKDRGWKRYSVAFYFKNGKKYQDLSGNDLYMRAFLKDICLRPSCYACEFKGLHRQSDITLADFWGIQNVLPELDDDKGTSLIFVNSVHGQSILDQIKDRILCKEVDINEAVSYNSAAIKSSKYNPKREEFLQELEKQPFDKLIKKYCSDTMLVRLKRGAKSIARKALK